MALRSSAWSVVLLTAVALVAACGAGAPAPAASVSVAPPAADAGRKVMVIVEENHGYDQIIGDRDAPYLNRLAAAYGTATRYDAGYPAHCPSLAAYILLTSGTTAGICDDNDPKAHPLTGDNLFRQVGAAGREWRDYAEALPGPCAQSSRGRYLVRHVPPTYYVGERADCRRWTVPIADLRHDAAAGDLPAYAFVSPDACNDMHGAAGCPTDLVGAGDRWLQKWLPRIMAGPDYRAGRLTVIVTFDEGTSTSNHIPTLVIAPTVRHVSTAQPLTHCSTLRFVEEQLRLPLLRCAAGAPSLGSPFGL